MYNWIETTFNVSGGITQAVAVILALAVVLLLFGLFIFILKRLMGASAPQSRNRQPRIAIMDSATVDARRRLLLIRRDNIEHLILVGGPSDVVVEQNIIRNTPLTQARTGHHAPAPSGMAMPVKAALAPGPEIPARPDELLPDEEVAAPAVQARMPVQSPEPAPQPATPAPQPTASVSPAPAPASTPAAPAYKAPSAAAATPAALITPPAAPTRSYAEPTVARPLAARAVEPAPAPSAATAAPSSAQQPTAPKASPAASHVASPAVSATVGGGLSRASDLLRAATQNGFNRAMPKPAEPVVPPVQEVQTPQSAGEPKVDITATLETDIQPSEPAAAMAKAPEVRPAVSAASAPQESRAASTLKSLARPFTARDRPSYGGTISPPASGPAARAKTALLKPVEPLQADNKVEPVLATATVAVASPQLAEENKAPSEENTPTPDQSAFAAPQPEEAADANDLTASAPQAAGEPAETAQTEAVEASAATVEDTAQTSAPTIDEDASTEAQSAEEDSPAREITLDIGDLLEDVPEPSAPAPASAAAQVDTSGTPKPQTDEPSAETSDDPEETTASATVTPTAPVASSPVTTSAPPVKAPVRPSAGLGDRNPIEEEMAKILDELGGQSNG
ncbi:hypothetical protein [Roseibium aggregatum]|uniref:hypothetical protein n=1 Tax=Roseibium aggregatum TaxID=187304 RepID=UPI003A97196F